MTDKLSTGLMSAMIAFCISCSCAAQSSSADASEPHQMIVTTRQGFIAIDTPKGWAQSEGPGLAFFLPEGQSARSAEVWIYINSAPVGPKEDDKDLASYIQSDIAGFKKRFKNAIVRRDNDLMLPEMKQAALVYTFQSGEAKNAFEQIIYIADEGRVLMLALMAKNSDAFAKSKKIFHEFAQSYRGSIQMGSPRDKTN